MMLRNLFAALAGGIFGLGLVVSDMTNTAKVQAWLDVFGDWNPTLAFVLGGAVIPMFFAWRLAGRLDRAALGSAMPERPAQVLGPDLILGSLMFGAGWGLSGLCPGPAIAVAGFGGWPAALFLVAMMAGMVAAPGLKARLTRLSQA